VALRRRDTDGDGALDETLYYIQNTRGDVTTVLRTPNLLRGKTRNQPRFSPRPCGSNLRGRVAPRGRERHPHRPAILLVRHASYKTELLHASQHLRGRGLSHPQALRHLNLCHAVFSIHQHIQHPPLPVMQAERLKLRANHRLQQSRGVQDQVQKRPLLTR
jgi:hypothetical protein